jgi:hypothetical protein
VVREEVIASSASAADLLQAQALRRKAAVLQQLFEAASPAATPEEHRGPRCARCRVTLPAHVFEKFLLAEVTAIFRVERQRDRGSELYFLDAGMRVY